MEQHGDLVWSRMSGLNLFVPHLFVSVLFHAADKKIEDKKMKTRDLSLFFVRCSDLCRDQ